LESPITFIELITEGAIGGRGGAETVGTVLAGVECLGNESALLDCPAVKTVDCVSQEIATVICQGNMLVLSVVKSVTVCAYRYSAGTFRVS